MIRRPIDRVKSPTAKRLVNSRARHYRESPVIRGRVIPLVILAIATTGSAAIASPFEDTTVGGAVFTGSTSPHATSLMINPAALARAGGGFHMYAGASARLSMTQIDRELVDPDTGATAPGPEVSSNVLSPGGLLAAYWRVSERGYMGIAIGSPLSERWADDEALAYHTMGGSFFQGQLTIAGAFRLGGRFHVGLGVSLAYTRFELGVARDTAMEAGSDPVRGVPSDCGGVPCGLENPLARQELDITVGTRGIEGFFDIPENVGLVLGALYEARGDWVIAASLVAPAGTFADLPLRGEASAIDAPRDGGARRGGDAEVRVRLAESVHLGASGPIAPELDLVAELRWSNSSRHRDFDLRMFGPALEAGEVPEWYPRYRGFRDTLRASVGVERKLGFPLRWGARLRFDSGAVSPERVTPIQIEGFNLTAAGGVSLRLADHFVLAANYDLTWYPERQANPSAFDPIDRLRCVDSMFDVEACAAAGEGRATATAAGDYRRLGHGFGLSIRYDSL
jgi:long-subunit fatty acid transport protein